MKSILVITCAALGFCVQAKSQTLPPNLQEVTGQGATTTNPVTFIHNSGNFSVKVTNNSDADFAVGITAPGATNKYASLQSTIANRNMILNGFNGGFVGIGTASPTQKLEVNGHIKFSSEYNQLLFPASLNVSGGITGDDGNYKRLTLFHGNSIAFETGSNTLSYSNTRMFISGAGDVGIGTTAPAYKLDVNGTAYISGSTISTGQVTAMNGTRLKATSGNGVQITGAAGVGIRGVGTNTTAGYAAIQTAYDNVNFLCPLTLQDQGGNVLIGKTTQTNANYKLDVNGIIRANKLVVNTTGADFVFEKGYHLPSLDSVEQYVKANQHLPGIAPAAEMQKEGVEVGEQQTKLLQKIEELTLYIIEQNKKIEKQGAQLQQQGEEIKQLKAKLK